MTGRARKMSGWFRVGVFYALLFMVGMALVGSGTVVATYALGVLQADASWHLVAGIALMVAGAAAFVGGVILLFRMTSISTPNWVTRNYDSSRTGEYVGYTDTEVGTFGGHGHTHGGGHHGGGSHSGGGGN